MRGQIMAKFHQSEHGDTLRKSRRNCEMLGIEADSVGSEGLVKACHVCMRKALGIRNGRWHSDGVTVLMMISGRVSV